MRGGDEDGETTGGRGEDRETGKPRLRFSLPPIRLPETAFPSDLRIVLPAPARDRDLGVSGSRLFALALAFDLLDAWLALAAAEPTLAWVRVVVGLGIAALLAGIAGSLYAWEAVAVAVGAGWLTAVPSLTLVLLARAGRNE